MKQSVLILPYLFLALGLSAQTYITNINVLDVERMKLKPAQTVEIKGDKIVAVGNSNQMKLPVNANVVDGTGKYLIPGLVDAHVHFFQSGDLYARPDAIDLRKFMPYENELEWTHRHMEDFLRR